MPDPNINFASFVLSLAATAAVHFGDRLEPGASEPGRRRSGGGRTDDRHPRAARREDPRQPHGRRAATARDRSSTNSACGSSRRKASRRESSRLERRCRQRARAGIGHVARRADDRLRVRHLHVDRPARSPVARLDSASAMPGGHAVLVDTTPDLRAQALAHNVRRVDAILYTHSHADHVMGLDDVRRFNVLQKATIPCYGDERTLRRPAAHLLVHLRCRHARRVEAFRRSCSRASPGSSASDRSRSCRCR